MYVCWLVWICVPAQAQYRFDSWTADNGLPQNAVPAIHQTRDGYLWLATSDGLARFDGVRFTVFDKNNSPGIASNRFTRFYEDRDGSLWIGTENGGVIRYFKGRFTTYTRPGRPAPVYGITGDKQGNLWVLFEDSSTRWTIMRWADGQFLPAAEWPRPLHGGEVCGRSGNSAGFWGVFDDRLLYFNGGQSFVWPLAEGLPVQNIIRVAEDQHGRLWAGMPQGELIRIENGRTVNVRAEHAGPYQLPGHNPKFVSGRSLKVMTIDRQGALWVTDLDSMQSHLIALQPPAGMADFGYIAIVYEDPEGNYWMGTTYKGMYRARRQAITVYSKQQGLARPNVYPIYEDRNGAIWIGTDALERFKDGVFSNYLVEERPFRNIVSALYEDREGRLWVGRTRDVEVFEKGRFRAPGAGFSPIDSTVLAVHQDHQGAFWFGTEQGLIRQQDGCATLFTAQDGLAAGNVNVIIEAAGGGLWIGGYSGLARYRDERFTAWSEQDGLPSKNVRALYEDREGVLWIGTYDGGLGRFTDGRFTRYTTREGLFNNGVFQILEDVRGNFWVSCNKGIYRVSKQELNELAAGQRRTITSVAYGKSDGLLNIECNGGRSPAGIKARDGKLYFPTQDGVAVIAPETLSTNTQPPPVVIEVFQLERQPVAFGQGVRIRPGQEQFEVEYTAISFINSERLQFRYKLEGLEQDWVEAGTRRTAHYTHVPPGNYTFRVIAANSDGVWNTAGQSILITVLPPFYRTWWFLTLIGLSVSAVLLAGFKYRVSQLEQRQEVQQAFARQLIESQEAERKRIAAELHDGLGQNLLVIKNRALFGLMQPNDVTRTTAQLTDISTTVSQALDEVRQIAANLHPYQLDRLGLTKALSAMIRKVGEAAQLDIALSLDTVDGRLDAMGEINLYRMMQESLNNIVKHAAASEVSIRLQHAPDSLHLTIRDDGQGFVIADRGSRIADSKNQMPVSPSGGLGLIGLAERARLLGGTLRIESAPGNGTMIMLTIPLPVPQR